MSFAVGWHAVSLSNGIAPGRSAGTLLFGKEIVIWRDSDGAAHVWEDRCPHRGMRLSFGFVRGNRIACLYHGWQYDTGGQCRFIPAHPALAVPPTIRVATYPCVERLGMLWMYADREVEAPPDLALEARTVTPVRSLYVDCTREQVLQRLAPRSENIGPPGVSLLALDTAGRQLLAAVQPFGEEKTALHLVLDGTCNAADQTAAAAWAESLRRGLEGAPVLPTGVATAGMGRVAP